MSKRRFKDDAYKDTKDSSPPMSRLFVVCSKSTTEDELRDEFEKFGDVSEIWLLKDRSTKESKGMRSIKLYLTHFSCSVRSRKRKNMIKHTKNLALS